MTTNKSSQAVTVIEETQALAPIMAALGEQTELLLDNSGPDAVLTWRHMDRLKIPAGGATVWKFPNGDTTTTNQDSVEAVILGVEYHRAYFASEYDGEAKAPDCHSNDMMRGSVELTPGQNFGGACRTCPMNQWTKKADGGYNSLPCKTRARVFLLTPDSSLPIVLDLPTKSVRVLKDYMAMLNKKRPMRQVWQVVSKLSLAEGKSGKLVFSMLKIERGDDLTPAEWVGIQAYKNAFTVWRTNRPVTDEGDSDGEVIESTVTPVAASTVTVGENDF